MNSWMEFCCFPRFGVDSPVGVTTRAGFLRPSWNLCPALRSALRFLRLSAVVVRRMFSGDCLNGVVVIAVIAIELAAAVIAIVIATANLIRIENSRPLHHFRPTLRFHLRSPPPQRLPCLR